ncbi:hypothetical protein GCM10009304_32310 [Pseudomonas matsuisoli]|uniref:Uncharacterized protein n=1 Tax=Pseudomonas matsuisoli TaxID=1515666 RepID=A0A917Q042_9PSED|nr:hypothetical protein GCM10009304_32310 [Pseudomonas matsuisoli]
MYIETEIRLKLLQPLPDTAAAKPDMLTKRFAGVKGAVAEPRQKSIHTKGGRRT